MVSLRTVVRHYCRELRRLEVQSRATLADVVKRDPEEHCRRLKHIASLKALKQRLKDRKGLKADIWVCHFLGAAPAIPPDYRALALRSFGLSA